MAVNQEHIIKFIQDVLSIPENAHNAIISHGFSALYEMETITNKYIKDIWINDQKPDITVDNPVGGDPITNSVLNAGFVHSR